MQVTRALLSVSDKTGIVDFARELANLGVALLSTGGTYKLIKDNGIPVQEVADYTGFPEMMDGRVKTLHPKIHGGILGRRGMDDEVMLQHDIGRIDLVVVNLYPFAQTVAKPNCSLEDAIENIDIGGPTMVRSAAKNNAHVGIVVDSSDYATVLAEVKATGGLSQATRFDLAVKAFEHTAAYDGMIANYLGRLVTEPAQQFSRTFNTQFIKAQDLRYGENPHQKAAFYVEANPKEISIATDVYALGVILYEILTDEYPYRVVGSIAEVLNNIIHSAPTPPSELLAARAAEGPTRIESHVLPTSVTTAKLPTAASIYAAYNQQRQAK